MDGWDCSRRAVSRTRARPRDRRTRGPTSIVVDSRLAARVVIQQQAENIKTTSKQTLLGETSECVDADDDDDE